MKEGYENHPNNGKYYNEPMLRLTFGQPPQLLGREHTCGQNGVVVNNAVVRIVGVAYANDNQDQSQSSVNQQLIAVGQLKYERFNQRPTYQHFSRLSYENNDILFNDQHMKFHRGTIIVFAFIKDTQEIANNNE